MRFLLTLLLLSLPLQAAKPNFLVIVTDDQRPDTIAALGNEIIDTPNLDRLVKQGTTFEHAIFQIFVFFAKLANFSKF